ncbi:microtubule-associated protein 4 [Nothoprocta perdicaria]|uniref:microtubule-associated protein 4 n=1 Tax=Nothoprocta perdicaria TaxID=30464 RepID=UPI000E1BC98A|nr:microtubule-associated protein 4 [Nothoprocta perdicaria]
MCACRSRGCSSMADLHPNLSLADALTEPPPEIEEEVKRDFIATLEAEKFDDVVGETVDKTDYVPLLDDDEDGKGSGQEPRSKAHADAVPGEHPSASGPMVVENGDHGLGNSRTAFPGGMMDESLSYEEFFARSAPSAMGDRDLCFEPQPVFKPAEMPAPHASMMVPDQAFLGPPYSPAEVLDPSAFIGLDSAAEYLQDTAVPGGAWPGAPHAAAGPGAAFFAEPPAADAGGVPAPDAVSVPAEEAGSLLMGAAEPPAAAATESSPAAEVLAAHAAAGACAPAAWDGAPHAADAAFALGADAALAPAADPQSPYAMGLEFAPAAADPKSPHAVGLEFAPEAANPKSPHAVGLEFAPAAADPPFPHAVGLEFAPAAGDPKSPHAVGLEFAPEAANLESPHAVGLEFAPEAANPESPHAVGLEFAPAAADPQSPHAVGLEFAPAAADPECQHAVDLEFSAAEGAGFAPAADAVPHHALDVAFAPAAGTTAAHAVALESAPAAEADHHGADPAFAPAAEAKAPPAVAAAFAPVPVAAAACEELTTSEPAAERDRPPLEKTPAEATANTEHECKVPEAGAELPVEEAKGEGSSPRHGAEQPPGTTDHLLEAAAPVEAKEAPALENQELLPENPAVSAALPITEKPKEEAEHNHIPHAEPRQEQPLQESTGPRGAQGGPAPHASGRRAGSADAAPGRAGLPRQKSPASKVEAPSAAAPRSRVPHQRAAEPPEPAESYGEGPRESWGLDGSSVGVKKKKKKPKQKRNQQPRAAGFWEESLSQAPKTCPFAFGLQKADLPPVLPAEARQERPLAQGNGALDAAKDAEGAAGRLILGGADVFRAAAPGEQRPKPDLLVASLLDARNGGFANAEDARGDGWMSQCNGKMKQLPVEPRDKAEKTKVGEPGTAKVPTQPGKMNHLDGNEKRVDKEAGCSVPKASPAEEADLSKGEAPLKASAAETPLSGRGKEAKSTSRKHKPGGETGPTGLPTSSGFLEKEAKKRGDEKSKEAENESFKEPDLELGAPLDRLPSEPNAADKAKAVSPGKSSEANLGASKAAPGTLAPTPLVGSAPGEVIPLGSGKAGGSSEQTLLAAAKSDATECPSAAEAAPGPAFIAPEHQFSKDAGLAPGLDKPKKRRGEGKVRKMRNFPEQVPVPEDAKAAGEWRLDEPIREVPFPEQGKENGAAAGAHPSAASAQGSAPRADKAKKRGSDGRSKKGERSVFQQPLLSEGKREAGSAAETTEKPREPRGGERGWVSAERPQESASEAAGTGDRGRVAQGVGGGQEPRMTQPEAASKSKEAEAMDRGREAAFPRPGDSAVAEFGATLAEKPRKRSSDGRRKNEKPPLGQAAALESRAEASPLLSKEVAGRTKEVGFGGHEGSGFGGEPSLEGQAGETRELVGRPEGQGGESQSCSRQQLLAAQETETAKAGTVQTGETWPTDKGKEGVVSPSEAVPESRPKKKGRDVKGRKAEKEQPGAAAPAQSPAAGVPATARAPGSGQGSRFPAAGSGQGPAAPAEPGTAGTRDGEEREETPGAPEPAFLVEPGAAGALPAAGPAAGPAPGAATSGPGLSPRRSEDSPVPELGRSEKKGSEGRSQEAKGASEEPVAAEAKASGREEQAASGPLGGAIEMAFVDENSNVCSLGPGGAGRAAPGFPVGAGEAAGDEGLPAYGAGPAAGALREMPKGRQEQHPGRAEVKEEDSAREAASREHRDTGEQPSMEPSVQEDTESNQDGAPRSARVKEGDGDTKSNQDVGPLSTGVKEGDGDTKSNQDVGLLSTGVKEGDGDTKSNQDGAPRSTSVKEGGEDTKSNQDVGPLSAGMKEGSEDTRVAEERQDPGCSSVPPRAATGTVSGTVTTEETASAMERDATCGSADIPVPLGSSAGETERPGDGQGHPGSSQEAAGLGDKAGAAVDALAAQPARMSREVPGDGGCELAHAARPGRALPEGVAAAKPQDAPKEEEEEPEEQTAKGAQKEDRAKGREQLRGYMRPTKARGAAGAAAAEREGAKQAGAAAPARQRPPKAKAGESKAAEVAAGNDISPPPTKELPPSPEKKAKAAASAPPAKAAAPRAKAAAASPRRPLSAAAAAPGPNKKGSSPPGGPGAAAAAPKRPATARPAAPAPKEAKPKVADAKSPEKRSSLSKPPSSVTPRTAVRSSPATPRTTAASPVAAAPGVKTIAASPPKRPTSIKTDAKPADAKKTAAKPPAADAGRPKSASGGAKSSAASPSAPAGSSPSVPAARPKPKAPTTKPAAGTTTTTAAAPADARKAAAKAPPKAGPAAKPPRPAGSVSAPDLKNVRSKIGSTDNIKHQPGGGKGNVEKKPEPAAAARKPEPNAGSKMAPARAALTKEGAPKQPNGKVQIVSKKANYSHVQSKCGSKDNIKHVPGGGNVQIQNKKVDLSKVSSKCGSKANIKHKPGGGDVKIENQKLNFKEKAQAKVGSLDSVGHVAAAGAAKGRGGPAAAPGTEAPRENGVGPAAGEPRDAQPFESRIQETN